MNTTTLPEHLEAKSPAGADICIAMPPWPGEAEAKFIKGPWQPTV